MLALIILVIFTLLLFYLLVDFLIIGGNVNKFSDKWVKKTLWLWLPFYALWKLTKEVIMKNK